MEYEIKISGSGSAKQLYEALMEIANDIKHASEGSQEEYILSGACWEYEVLTTEIEANYE